MRTKSVAVAVAALGLVAWADPKTVAPVVTKDAAAEEAKRQMVYVLKARARENVRVEDIAFRIMVANADLCADRAPRAGLNWRIADAYDAKVRPAAVEAFQLGDGLTVTDVRAGGPAEAAGLRAGDVMVSIAGRPAPTGKKAAAEADKLWREAIGKEGKPVSVVLRRAGQEQTVLVTPVTACAYGVEVQDTQILNAFADGGGIYVTRPMLKLATTDEELALVIAHEVAHNGQHHLQAQAHNALILGLPGLLIDVAAAANGVNTQGRFTKMGADIGRAHAAPQFEAEADYVGLYYMARAGYRTEGAEEFWRKMAAEAPSSIFIKSDHPPTPERFLAISAASKEVEAKRAAGEALVPNLKGT